MLRVGPCFVSARPRILRSSLFGGVRARCRALSARLRANFSNDRHSIRLGALCPEVDAVVLVTVSMNHDLSGMRRWTGSPFLGLERMPGDFGLIEVSCLGSFPGGAACAPILYSPRTCRSCAPLVTLRRRSEPPRAAPDHGCRRRRMRWGPLGAGQGVGFDIGPRVGPGVGPSVGPGLGPGVGAGVGAGRRAGRRAGRWGRRCSGLCAGVAPGVGGGVGPCGAGVGTGVGLCVGPGVGSGSRHRRGAGVDAGVWGRCVCPDVGSGVGPGAGSERLSGSARFLRHARPLRGRPCATSPGSRPPSTRREPSSTATTPSASPSASCGKQRGGQLRECLCVGALPLRRIRGISWIRGAALVITSGR